jgi:hypothetical protein
MDKIALKTPVSPSIRLVTNTVRFLICAVAFAVIAFLCSCAEGPTVPASNPKSPEAAGAPVVLLDEDMEDNIAVDQVRFGRTSNNLLAVQANIRNRTDHDISIQVQTLYRDQFGNALYFNPGDETPWMNMVVTANSTTPYRSQSLSAAAQNFTVRIRYMKRPSRD